MSLAEQKICILETDDFEAISKALVNAKIYLDDFGGFDR